MTRKYLKLQLRAFNGECDAAVAKVKYSNVVALQKRIDRAFEAINKLGATQRCEISAQYLDLKQAELALTHEYQEQRHEEKEEQRRIRDQMREEERALREIEKAKRDAEREEKRQRDALEKARKELAEARDSQRGKLTDRIAELERRLLEAQSNRERVISRAQMTKSGHVYVVSNVGSFGDDVYKIGMTRRLEPMDRVKELGDASVPFGFDVHAMVFSENAPELEASLHRSFDEKRLNLVNRRKEFFRVAIEDVQAIVRKKHADTEFILTAAAEQYRKTMALQADATKSDSAVDSDEISVAREALTERVARWDADDDANAG